MATLKNAGNMDKNPLILADGRWVGTHGIGRFSHEVLSRLKNISILREGPPPLSIQNLFWQPYYLYRHKNKYKLFFTPGFNPVSISTMPSIITIADLIHLYGPEKQNVAKKAFYEFLIKPSLYRALKIFTVSEFSKRSIAEWGNIPSEKIINVGCGISASFYPDGEKHDPGYPYFLYVGNMKAHKNIPRLIHAFANADFDGKLILTGERSPLILEIIQKKHLENRIIFSKKLDEETLAKYYRGAMGLLFPSLYEGFGLPPLEAMACGTPVLASNVTSIPEVVGNAVLLINPYEQDAITEGINQLVHDDALRKSFLRLGLERAQVFSWDKTAGKIQEVLDEVVF